MTILVTPELIHSFLYLFIYVFIHNVHQLIHSFIYSFIHTVSQSVSNSFQTPIAVVLYDSSQHMIYCSLCCLECID